MQQPESKTFSTKPCWINPSPTKRTYPQILGKAGEFDVAIVGGGIVGVTTAYLLKQSGQRVALIEARECGTGTTGSSTAKLTSQQNLIYSELTTKHGENVAKLYGEMQEAAISEAAKIVEQLKLDCDFKRSSHYTWTSEQKNVDSIKQEAEKAIAYGLPAEYINGSPSDLPSSLNGLAAVRFSNQVIFNPYKFCEQLAAHVDGNGSSVFEWSRVEDVSNPIASSDQHKVKTKDGEVHATRVVIATHLPILDISGHFAFLPPDRSHCIVVKLTKPSGLEGMCYGIDEPSRSLRVVSEDGLHLQIAGEHIDQGEESKECYQRLEDWARKYLSVQHIESRWSALDYMSSDKLPWIGLLNAGSTSIYTATGFNKWGLSNGIASAILIRDMIHGVKNSWSDMVDSKRWDLLKTGPGLAKESAHTTKHFVGDKLHALVAPSISTLKPGQGGVVKDDRHGTVGAFLDENGKYHVVDPVCTHLGCHLKFNHGDKAWDCPCHGSRFEIDGSIVHGPACKNLKVYEW